MGYTTKFKGRFEFTGNVPAETILALMDLAQNDGDEQPKGSPGGYCQWELTKDRKGLQWDSNEKFYDYDKWLQYIIDHVLRPSNVGLSGSVQYAGEDIEDRGVLQVENGTVLKRKAALVDESLEELKRFKDYVLKSDWADEILSGWVKR